MKKSKKSIQKYYWDANVFLHLIDETSDKIGVLQAFLQKAHDKEVIIYSSALNITEVAYGHEERIKQELSEDLLKKIDKLWHPSSPITLVDIHPPILFKARALIRLCRANGLTGLRSADSIHLATAQNMDVDVFHCYESAKKLVKYGELINMVIKEPELDQPLLFDNEQKEEEINP